MSTQLDAEEQESAVRHQLALTRLVARVCDPFNSPGTNAPLSREEKAAVLWAEMRILLLEQKAGIAPGTPTYKILP